MPATPWVAGQRVRVAVPASSANLGPGFDSVGVALDIVDHCTLSVRSDPGVEVRVSGQGSGTVPLDDQHLVVRSMRRAWEVIGVRAPSGYLVECHGAVPHGRGLGSSATAIVAGVGAAYALHALATSGRAAIDLGAVNDLAANLEGHPDNSSASVYGGMTLSWPDDDPGEGDIPRTMTVCLSPHPDIRPVVLVPQDQLSTATARAVLPSQVRLADAAANAARVGALVHAMTQAPGLLLAATRDYLHQEPRRPAYAASMAMVDSLRQAGIAAVISGAGPSVLALAVAEQAGFVAARAPQTWRIVDPGFALVGVRVLDEPVPE